MIATTSKWGQFVENWLPTSKITWLIAVFAVAIIASGTVRIGEAAFNAAFADNSPIVAVLDHQPPEVTIRQGDPVTINYLYTRRACDAVATYTITPTEKSDARNYTIGPFLATAAATKEPKWIKSIANIGTEKIPPGDYQMSWVLTGRCNGEMGERPSSHELFQRGPVTRLIILPKV